MAKAILATKTKKAAAKKATPAKKAASAKAAAKKVPAKKDSGKSAAKTLPVSSKKLKSADVKKDKFAFKYSDKSRGQPAELLQIWEVIRDMMLPYQKGAMKVHGGSGGQITLISHKPAEIFGRKRNEVWFAAALIQKGYVGFYLMPVYGAGAMLAIRPELMKCLKGKACFHIKKNDPELLKQVEESLKLGFDAYRASGCI